MQVLTNLSVPWIKYNIYHTNKYKKTGVSLNKCALVNLQYQTTRQLTKYF